VTQRGLINLHVNVFWLYREIVRSREVLRKASVGNIVFFHLNPIKNPYKIHRRSLYVLHIAVNMVLNLTMMFYVVFRTTLQNNKTTLYLRGLVWVRALMGFPVLVSFTSE
jgi:hypothetical protein